MDILKKLNDNMDDSFETFLFGLVEQLKFTLYTGSQAASTGVKWRASVGIPIAYHVADKELRDQMIEVLKRFSIEACNKIEVLAPEIYPNIVIDKDLTELVTSYFGRITERIMSNQVPYKDMMPERVEAEKVATKDYGKMFSMAINFSLHEDKFGDISIPNPILGWYVCSWRVQPDGEGAWEATGLVEDNFILDQIDALKNS